MWLWCSWLCLRLRAITIEHNWGNCLAQLNPKFIPPGLTAVFKEAARAPQRFNS